MDTEDLLRLVYEEMAANPELVTNEDWLKKNGISKKVVNVLCEYAIIEANQNLDEGYPPHQIVWDAMLSGFKIGWACGTQYGQRA